MMRLLSLAVGILLVASAHVAMAQAQVAVPPDKGQVTAPAKKVQQAPAHIDSEIDTDELADAGGGAADPWLQKQADALLDLVGCYLPKKSLDNEVATETKTNSDPRRLIEVRIHLLKTLASHNTPSQCK